MHDHSDDMRYRLTKWDSRFLELAVFVASWSIDRTMRVGAVVVVDANVILATGFNGMPRGVNDHVESRREIGSPEKDLWTEHAERNAIYNAARVGVSLAGSRMYTTHFPCAHCARGIIQSGIRVLVSSQGPDPNYEKYIESWQRSLVMLSEASVLVICADRFDSPVSETEVRVVADHCPELLKGFGTKELG